MANQKLSTELVLRELLRDRVDSVVELALAARRQVLKIAGPCSEIIYEVYCISNAFTFSGKQGQGFIHIATYSQHVNLGFDFGSELEDPEQLLQGTGKRIRHIRLNSPSHLKQKAVAQLISAAAEHGRGLAEQAGGIAPATVVVKRKTK